MRRALIAVIVLAVAAVAAWLALRDADPGDAAVDETRGATSRPAQELPPDLARSQSAGAAERTESGSTDAPEDAPPLDLSGARAVTGRVRFASGAPAVHAWISAAPDDGKPSKGREIFGESEAEGEYRIALPPGRFRLGARHAGTGTARAVIDVERGSGDVAGPTLVLDEGGIIVGRVFGADGAPLGDVRVKAAAESGSTVFFTDRGTQIQLGSDDVLTDDNGGFRLKGLERGDKHRVWVEFFPRDDLLAVPERYEGVLPDGPPLTFGVKGKRAIEGVVISADTKEPLTSFKLDGFLVKDPHGHFEAAVARGQAPTFEALGFVKQERDDLRLNDQERRTGIVIAMERDPDTGSLVVEVIDDEQKKVDDFRVVLSAFGAEWDLPFAGAHGEARIVGVKTGQWDGLVRSSRHQNGRFKASVASGPGVETHVLVVIARGAPVALSIVDKDGAPWTGEIAIADEDGKGPEWRFLPKERVGTLIWITEADVPAAPLPQHCGLQPAAGVIEALATGRYTLIVYAPDGERRVPFEVFAETPGDVRVKL